MGYKVFDRLTQLSLRFFGMTESSNKTILRSSADWPRWFANIYDQAKYKHIWDYINPDAVRMATESIGTATGSFETIGTITGDINVVIITTATFLFEPSIIEDISDASFKIQLERYRY